MLWQPSAYQDQDTAFAEALASAFSALASGLRPGRSRATNWHVDMTCGAFVVSIAYKVAEHNYLHDPAQSPYNNLPPFQHSSINPSPLTPPPPHPLTKTDATHIRGWSCRTRRIPRPSTGAPSATSNSAPRGTSRAISTRPHATAASPLHVPSATSRLPDLILAHAMNVAAVSALALPKRCGAELSVSGSVAGEKA
jgi:hypothetical protein